MLDGVHVICALEMVALQRRSFSTIFSSSRSSDISFRSPHQNLERFLTSS